MTLRKSKAPRAQARKRASMGAQTVVRSWMDESPDVRLVLEIAARAHAIEFREPPRDLGVVTDVVAIPTNSQHPV
jgi:hypothetical protein